MSNHHHIDRQFMVISRTVGLILIYYLFSIGITFYQKWFIKRFHYPLIVVVCHMVVKFLLATLFRALYRHVTGTSRITLHWKENIRRISLPGIASALDIGFSNWSFEFITISLYTMTKSTCIIFILAFALLFDLEKKRLSLIIVVSLISIGLFMFTYKSTQFQLNGFLLVLSASMLSGLRWTLSQKLMQRKEHSLSHPLDMMYHIQPWMILGLFPLAFIFELMPTMHSYISANHHHYHQHPAVAPTVATVLVKDELTQFDMAYFTQIVHLILIGSILAFLMEFSEYLLLTFTSSLTLSMAGIFKEVFTLYLAVNYNGDQMSLTNFIGLIICLVGIIIHVMLKALDSSGSDSVTLIHHKTPVNQMMNEEMIEAKRLLDDNDVIHFDMNSASNVITMNNTNTSPGATNNLPNSMITMFGAKSL